MPSPRALATRLLAASLGTALLAAQTAWACGGCFSMTPPPPPGQQDQQYVVQDAERVLFVQDPATKKATVWVEVRYTGAAQDFGWVLPLPKQPKVSVGSRYIFDRLDQQTAPRFQSTYGGQENCRDPYDGCVEGRLAVPTAQDATYGYGDSSADAAGGGGGGFDGVTVLDQGQTGPYDYTVLSATDTTPLYDWLNTRGYKTPAAAKPILEAHIKKGDVFVAIKLSNGKGVEMVRPIALEMTDAEPCVPLRLTSIAAASEMTVSVTVAGPGRTVPKNTLHVVPNWARLNWFTAASNYPQVVSAAIDEAGGNAFSTEFAGSPNAIIDPLFIPVGVMNGLTFIKNLSDLANWMATNPQFAATELVGDLDGVVGFGTKNGLSAAEAWAVLSDCAVNWEYSASCTRYLPSGKSLTITTDDAKAFAVDGQALHEALDVSFFKPINDVAAAVKATPKLTRLLMRISPEEMDRDPVFAFNPTLPDVDNVHTAVFKQVCGEGWLPAQQSRLTIDGLGSWVFQGTPPNGGGQLGNNTQDTRFKAAPTALRIEVLDETGGPILIDPTQAGVVSSSIAGAVPGKPTLPKDLVLKTVSQWKAPPDNGLVTTTGGWPKPQSQFGNCTPKPGWADGKVPPTQPPIDGIDATSGDSTGSVSDAGASDLGQAGGSDTGTPSSTASPSSSSCTAQTRGNPWWLVMLVGVGLLLGLRRRAR